MPAKTHQTQAINVSRLRQVGLLAIGLAWFLAMAITSSRIYFLNPYAVSSVLPPALEPFGMTPAAMALCLGLVCVWMVWANRARDCVRARIYLLLASAPVVPWLLALVGIVHFKPFFAEILWLSTWSGLSFGELAAHWSARSLSKQPTSQERSAMPIALFALAIACGVWWSCQLVWYHDNFLLGYNDFGHFLQRLSNTLSGQGLLVETPVLPRFWDHFNPGLLLLIPLWVLWPDVQQAFGWQAISLAISGYLVYRIALALRHHVRVAALFGIAWLVHPAVGQMNLAYTYGWHPITLAIPLLLGTIWALLQQRRWLALACCAVALSMEEGVFVVVSLTAICCGGWRWLRSRRSTGPSEPEEQAALSDFASALSVRTWLSIGVIAAALFVIIYKTSGLAEFQAGRFVTLGSNTTEILLSPILRPKAFWGAWLSLNRWYYAILLVLPCGLPALVRGWPYLLPIGLPLAVLTVWDHPPAHCIAFQYASTLLPLIWLASMSGATQHTGSQRSSLASASAVTACITGLVLSLFVGQLPYSGWTLADVDGQSYGTQEGLRRRRAEEDGIWLAEQLQQVRLKPAHCLATGRIAAHLVGMPDLETVGQYVERRDQLSRLPGRQDPIEHYRWIVLDRREGFQQSPKQTQAVEAEARAAGFIEVAASYDIIILQRRD